VSAVYLGVAALQIWTRGDDPAAPAVVASTASALSIGLVAWMARHAMLGIAPLVGLASLVAATHAWAVACLVSGPAGALAFPLTVLGAALVISRLRELATALAAVGLAFLAALAASAVAHPLEAMLELLGASLAAFGFALAASAGRWISSRG
jgi:hypothetical protein